MVPPVTARRESSARSTTVDGGRRVQTGIGRTGKLLPSTSERTTGHFGREGSGGGAYPVSAALCDSRSCSVPGEHGSTYGGNPVAARVAMASSTR